MRVVPLATNTFLQRGWKSATRMKGYNLKPFDLKAALAGAPVVTRDGRAVTQLMIFSGVYGKPLAGVVPAESILEAIVVRWRDNGAYWTTGESAYDLFMAPSKVTRWMNIHPNRVAFHYPTQDIADSNVGGFARVGGRAWPLEFEE